MSCGCEDSTTLTTGIDGYNAYTITTASYVQPAVNTNVTISVSNTGQYTGVWAIPDQTIFIDDGGYYVVVSATATSITIKYESDYATFNQSLTAAAGTVATNKKVSPAGKRGTDGIAGTSILYSYNDLTGVSNNAATGENTLGSYTVLANELTEDNDELNIDIYYEYFNSDEVVMRLKFGGSTIYSYEELGSLDMNNFLNIKIVRLTTTSQLWTITKIGADSTKLYKSSLVAQTSSSATLSNSNLFEITADNIVFGATQLTLKKLVIKKYNV